MKWKSIFKKQAVLLLIVSTAMIYTSVNAGSGSILTNPKGLNSIAGGVSGKVTDANGVAMAGVTITVKGTTLKAVSGADGTYSIAQATNNARLVFSMVGFYTTEKQASLGVLNVSLAEDVKKLDEVIVIGYGTQKKGDLTGSVSTVSGEKLNQGINQSAAHALQGQAAGVTVIQNSGEPGAGVEIRIRGAGSINDNSPLYVVDGMIGGIGSLNPADIESLTVLKDAASAAIYGARGANGVVIVTTKKGKRNQKASVSYNSSFGNQSVWKMPSSLDAAQRNLIHKEALTNDGVDPSETIWNYYNDAANAVTRTDLFKEVFQTAPIANHNLSVQGGGEKSNYLFSLGYLDNNGIVLGTNSKR